MKQLSVYQLRADQSHRWLTFVRRVLPPLAMQFDGTPMRPGWEPPAVEEIVEGDKKGKPAGDHAYLDGLPALSGKAVEVLRDLLEPNGELLPVRSVLGPYFVYNVTRVVDALDEEQSKLVRFASSGRVMEIEEFAFVESRLSGAAAFRIPQNLTAPPLVQAQFKERVESAGLTGFRFTRVW